jgi:hypothetical protein
VGGEWVGTRKGGMRVYMVYVFCTTYENRRMKPVEAVLRKWGGQKRENKGGDKSNKDIL